MAPSGCVTRSSICPFRTLDAGQAVEFDYELAQRDGCDFRAVSVRACG